MAAIILLAFKHTLFVLINKELYNLLTSR